MFALTDSSEVRIPGVKYGSTWSLLNGPETLVLLEPNDSTGCLQVPVFAGSICIGADGRGAWTDVLRPDSYSVPLVWEEGAAPSIETHGPDTLSWRLTFGHEDPWYGDLFVTASAQGGLTGTISTATGDFRYLHGAWTDAGELTLQTFDGAHLFLFTATREASGSLSHGRFYSGTHYSTPFTGEHLVRSHTPLSQGKQALWTGETLGYKGLDLNGEPVFWSARRLTHPHLLSVMGSWCPNCMDEHRLILDLMAQFPSLEVHTLAFERGLDRDGGIKSALARLKRYAQEMGVTQWEDRWHTTLVGPASKTAARDSLPFLDQVISFPTTIVVSPSLPEPWIHSGFNGPATGPAYDLEKARFVRALNGGSQESH